MIKPIQFCSASPFGAFNTNSTDIKTAAPVATNVPQEDKVEVKTPKKKLTFADVKNKFFNIVKGVNTATGTTTGVAKGTLFGGLALGATGVVAKNIKEANSNIWKSISGIAVDTGKVLKKAVCSIPDVVTKSPLENLKNLTSVPKKFYSQYLKGHKGIALAATVVGLGVLAFHTVKGKIKANEQNANIDHKVNTGHAR